MEEERETSSLGGRRSSNTTRQALALAAFFVAYLAIIHYPNSFAGIVRFSIWLRNRGNTGNIDIAASYLYVCLPVLILLIALVVGRGRTQARLALAAKILAGIAIPVALLDLLIAPLIAGPGANVLLLISASVLFWHLLVFTWAAWLRSSSLLLNRVILLLSTPIVALMAWSLIAAASAAYQIHQLAGGRPYCVARTESGLLGPGSFGYGPIRALEGLRGTRLFTTFTGYKDSSQWYFHAVLIVEGENGREYWNWSISRMRFEPFYRPDRFIERPTYICQPAPSFLARTPWF